MKRGPFCGFREENYFVSWQPSSRQLERMYELRAEVFCRELGWIKPSRPFERDEYDNAAVHIIISDESSEPLAAVRLLAHDAQWMLDTVFRGLLATAVVNKQQDAMEVSRLAVAAGLRHIRLRNGKRLSELLYKGVYAYCQLHAVRYLYMVTSNVVHRHLNCAGLPCEAMARPQQFPDGVLALAAKLDLSRLDRNPELLGWYQSRCPVESPKGLQGGVAGGGDVHTLWKRARCDASSQRLGSPDLHVV